MNLKVFDVVELTNGFKVIVVKVDSKGYIVKAVDDCYNELFLINEEDIKKILFKK